MKKINIPPIFLGTGPFKELGSYRFPELRTIHAVSFGIRLGYGIDCAAAYGNHVQVGRGLKASSRKRGSIFLTTKLYNTQQDNHVKEHYSALCKELDVNYVDLLLLHWPQTSTYINAWKQMEELYDKGIVRYIGIANAELRHLNEMENKCSILPHVIQIERNPLNIQQEVIDFCKEKGIIVQAYAPIGRMNEMLLGKTVLKKVSSKYHKTIPQIILKWQVQTGVIPVVRSVRCERIRQNYNIWDFELEMEEIKEISKLDCNYRIYDPRRYARYY